MYYDNKSTFYIKQYGPAICTITISLVLVLGGLYIYLSSNKSNQPKDTLVAKNVSIAEQSNSNQVYALEEQVNALKPEDTQDNKQEEVTTPQTEVATNINDLTISTVCTPELKSLKKLERSKEITILGIDDDYNIILNISNNNYKASLIGVDYKKSTEKIKDKLNKDLTNKKVTIAFDNVKLQENKLCIYLYIDDKLYNKELLNEGFAILNVEKANTSMLNEFVIAQKNAKSNSLGIWNK